MILAWSWSSAPPSVRIVEGAAKRRAGRDGLPVGVGAVAAAEVGELVEAELLGGGGLLIDLDAEAGAVGHVELGAVEDGADGEEGVGVAVGAVARGEGLEPGEVGDSGGEVDAGGG